MPKSDLYGDIAISPDARTVAGFHGENGIQSVWLGRPNNGLKQYLPAPFATREVYNWARLRFSPDGTHILVAMNGGRGGEEVWLLPYPGGASLPKRIFSDLQSFGRYVEYCVAAR
jgi:hypothetical protein